MVDEDSLEKLADKIFRRRRSDRIRKIFEEEDEGKSEKTKKLEVKSKDGKRAVVKF